jgi:NADP-dependent 3-hydroxy acid dehydrogenase YdfG
MGAKLLNSLNPKDFSDTVQLDLQSNDSIAAATTYLTETYSHIEVLINNAGVLLGRANLTMHQLYDTTFSTNVAGTASLTESLLALLR